MRERSPVLNHADHEENIDRWRRDLGTNKIRRKLFNEIYGRISKPRSKKQLMAAVGIKAKDNQQTQNQLEALVGKHLILRIDNDGSVKDGSRYLYKKEPHVAVYKDRIVQLADNRKLAESIPTKRRPIVRGVVTTPAKFNATRSVLKKRKRLDILYLTANPDQHNALRVDVEVRQVLEAVRGSKLRDNVEIRQRPAADLKTLVDGLNDFSPGIVHFSGHGYAGGVAVDHAKIARPKGKVVTFELLGDAFAAVDNAPTVVVLNSCHSAGARKALLPHVKAIAVMQDSISDVAASAFATNFYAAIAAGQSLGAAFALGQLAVKAVSINEAAIPELILRSGVNARRLFLT